MIPLTPIYFTTSSEYTLPEARTQISFLLILRFDQFYIPVLVDAWGTQSRSKNPLLIERAFQFELESKLSNGRERFVSFLHSRDVRVSRPACLHNQDTSNLSANLRTALPKKYLLTFHWFYSFKYQAASFWNCHAMKNMGLITRTYIHTWAWMRNPKAIFKEKVSLSRRKTPHCSVVVNSAGTSSKDIPHSMWVVLKRFRLSLTSELQDLILDSSDFCRQQKGY